MGVPRDGDTLLVNERCSNLEWFGGGLLGTNLGSAQTIWELLHLIPFDGWSPRKFPDRGLLASMITLMTMTAEGDVPFLVCAINVNNSEVEHDILW
jgi:hypothetical protein